MKNSSFTMIKQPVIKKMEFLGNNDFSSDKKDSKVKMEIKIKKESSTSERKAQVFLELNLNKECKLEEVPFILKAEIMGQFSWDNKATEEEINIFLNSTSPSILLSYMRPIVSNLITFSGLPAFIIPFLDLRME